MNDDKLVPELHDVGKLIGKILIKISKDTILRELIGQTSTFKSQQIKHGRELRYIITKKEISIFLY